MPLQRKLDDEELDLLEIIEDPVWCGEFLRTTSDGETDQTLWPTKPWYYRDYQRQLLTDKSEFIVLTGGRAIGKCQPITSKVYTIDGYVTIHDLLQKPCFTVYALTPEMQLVQRRAICLPDLQCSLNTIVTWTGHKVTGTLNHPVLTPHGYKLIQDIKVGDYVAVTTFLPHESTNRALQWHELRWLGYYIPLMSEKVHVTADTPLNPRFRKIEAELKLMSHKFLTCWRKDEFGNFWFVRKVGPFKHPIRALMLEMGITMHSGRNLCRLPPVLMRECLEHNKLFLEASFAQHGTLSTKAVTLNVNHETVALHYQEMLLRFGIETTIIENEDTWTIKLLDQRAVYRFWTTFKIPGVATTNVPMPEITHDATEFMRFDPVVENKESHKKVKTYAIYVYEHNNYISGNVFVHNTVVLEDKLTHELINNDICLPETKESLLVTPNQAQMGLLLNKLIQRFTGGKLLKDFLKNNINKSEGTMIFSQRNRPTIFRFRIAGTGGEANLVGMHLPRITGDECQLFPLNGFNQLGPCFNFWEKKKQQLWAGVKW